jgi:hypothetical protein
VLCSIKLRLPLKRLGIAGMVISIAKFKVPNKKENTKISVASVNLKMINLFFNYDQFNAIAI